MTHPPEAVEAVAKFASDHALLIASGCNMSVIILDATALLDQIAPHYREQAAEKVDARRAKVLAALSKAIPRSAQFYSLRNKDEALEDVAAAIRKGE